MPRDSLFSHSLIGDQFERYISDLRAQPGAELRDSDCPWRPLLSIHNRIHKI